ncbi:MAG: dihydroorotate dehydrogenase electron transfer subunit [Planctomycetaceae bacterium]|nr:dihydroorotate dehydrogenase electron transfer subunit [Planctomycetaceae bacterium]
MEILENVAVAERTYRLRFRVPGFSDIFTPGQFVMLRLTDTADPLLGRPLAVYRSDRKTDDVEAVYLVVGKMTAKLAQLPQKTPLTVWGPLGNGFQIPETENLIMVAGGIGQTPFLTLAEEARKYCKKVTLLFGAKSQSRICCMEDFLALGVEVQIATEDGSAGHHGFVTDLMTPWERGKTVIVSCGPRPMLQAVYRKAVELGNLPCFVSLESPMACGLGICYSCVVEYKKDNGTNDYVRTCVDGPVFDAYRLVW